MNQPTTTSRVDPASADSSPLRKALQTARQQMRSTRLANVAAATSALAVVCMTAAIATERRAFAVVAGASLGLGALVALLAARPRVRDLSHRLGDDFNEAQELLRAESDWTLPVRELGEQCRAKAGRRWSLATTSTAVLLALVATRLAGILAPPAPVLLRPAVVAWDYVAPLTRPAVADQVPGTAPPFLPLTVAVPSDPTVVQPPVGDMVQDTRDLVVVHDLLQAAGDALQAGNSVSGGAQSPLELVRRAAEVAGKQQSGAVRDAVDAAKTTLEQLAGGQGDVRRALDSLQSALQKVDEVLRALLDIFQQLGEALGLLQDVADFLGQISGGAGTGATKGGASGGDPSIGDRLAEAIASGLQGRPLVVQCPAGSFSVSFGPKSPGPGAPSPGNHSGRPSGKRGTGETGPDGTAQSIHGNGGSSPNEPVTGGTR